MVRQLCAVAAALVTAGAAATAAPAAGGGICPTFKVGSVSYQWETVGNVTCAKAKKWVVKLIHTHVAPTGNRVVLHTGPKGFHCFATLEAKGQVTGGVCYTHTLAFPGNGFTWNGT
jgi:hypothetical protein